MKKVAIVMGSDSDLPVLESAIKTLNQFEVPCEVRVLSAHRTPVEAADFARNARANGFGAIIAAAGKAAHLAGAMAAGTTLPVIGIPVKYKYPSHSHQRSDPTGLLPFGSSGPHGRCPRCR